jgi:hypothetical protein
METTVFFIFIDFQRRIKRMTTINTAQPSVSVFMISAVLSSSQITKE